MNKNMNNYKYNFTFTFFTHQVQQYTQIIIEKIYKVLKFITYDRVSLFLAHCDEMH